VVLIAAVVLIAGGVFVAGKAKQKFGEFEKNPALAAAELVVRANPELELVESDADEGTLTVRNKKTGEVATVDLQDIQEGRVSFKSGDEESTLTFGGEGDEGHMTITGGEGEKTYQVGGKAEVPDWVPLYPGTRPTGTYSMTAGEEHRGAFTLATGDSADEVLDFYGEVVDELGSEVHRQTFSSADSEGGILSGKSADGRRELSVTVSSRAGETTIAVTYAETP
jgi:hypothetical protein